jgi:MFS family permease
MGALHHIRSRTQSRPRDQIVSWTVDDPENPYNWSTRKKASVMIITAIIIVNSTMGSALPSMAIPSIMDEFGVSSDVQRVLPVSIFLIGYVLGPLLWGPLSEHLGRRNLTIATFLAFTLFTMACALAPSWPALLIFRLFCGVLASAPIAVVAGILADVFGDARTRGRAFAIFMCVSRPPIFRLVYDISRGFAQLFSIL